MKKRTKVVISAIVWHDHKILLLKRAKHFKELSIGKDIWDLPGGKVGYGMGLEEALQKELTEETANITLNPSLKLEKVLSYTINDKESITHRINIVYSLKLDEAPAIQLSEEHHDYLFTNNQSLIMELNMMQPIKELVLDLLRRR